MRITKKKIVAAVATTAVVALGGTAAFAYFTTTGSGSAAASVGSATPWNVVVSANTGSAVLLPGVGTQTFPYSVNNLGASAQTLNLVTAAFVVDVNGDINGAPNCKSSWFTIVPNGQPAGPVAPGGSNTGTVTITMIDSGTNQNACEGVSPAFTVNAS